MELKPCPFCGGEEVRTFKYSFAGEPDVYAQCQNCAADGPMGDTKEMAVEKWNRRATDENAAYERAAMVCEGVEITDAELHGLGHVFHGNKCAAAIRALKK